MNESRVTTPAESGPQAQVREEERNDRKERKGRKPALIMAPLLLLGLFGGLLYYARSQTRIVTDDAYVQATVFSIGPQIPGRVIEVAVASNQEVQAGQLLVRLDPEEYALKVRMASAALESARTRHEEAVIGETAAAAEEKLVNVHFAQARLDLERAEALFGKRTIPKDQYDRAVTQHRVFSAQQDVVKAGKVLARARTVSAASLLENARARLADAELLLSYTEIRSSGKGVVTNKSVEAGNIVQPGFPLMAVVDLEDLWVVANFKETQIRHLRPGLKAEIEVDSYAGMTLHGHVESIEAGSGAAFSLFPAENATGNWVKVVQRVPVKLLLDAYRPEPGGPVLRVGMSAVVTVRPEVLPFLPRLFAFLPGF